MIKSSDDEAEPSQKSYPNYWQVIRSAKRKRLSNQYPTTPQDIATANRYDLQQQQQPDIMHQEHDSTPSIPKPPPIFVHRVQNYADMVKRIQKIAEQEQYITKSLANNIVKINCATPETCKKMVRGFDE
jgi:hypothetical protein